MAKKKKQPKTPESGNDPKKKGLIRRLFGSRWVLIALGVVLVLAAAAAGWYFFLRSPEEAPAPDVSMEEGALPGELAAEDVYPELIALEPFEEIPLVPSGNFRSASLTVTLEMADPGMKAELLQQVGIVRAIVEQVTGTMTWTELRLPEGKLKLKYRLIRTLNERLNRVKIRNLYFKDFLMQ